ncbi:MAG: APC family permease [Chlamydiae bacterium]|nr:APC family permease [Chlamydiota bacterium]
MKEEYKVTRTLSVFMLTMINVATIGSIKNWPIMAEYGLSSAFFYLFATLVFFLPASLVSAELATGWPKIGGVFVWVKEAFGHRIGFLSVWLLWFQTIVWYPTALTLVAGAIAYLIDPTLAGNKIFSFSVVFVLFWITTLINFRGMRTSGWISSIGMIFGTFLPGLFIIALGVAWLFSGNPSHIEWKAEDFFPNMTSFHQMVLFIGVMISLAGMEMSAVHARDVEHPKKDYPKAILFSALIILGLSIPGSLAIALVIPQKEINLLSGALQALSIFLQSYGLQKFTPLLALLIGVGTIASISTWIVGPTKGLLAAAQSGDLPPLFRKINKHGMPVPLLIAQAIIVSFLSLLFIFLPTLNEAYWILMAVVSELYLLMYLFMFAAAIVLRYKKPHVERPYKIPGGKFGIWTIASLGFLSSLFAMIVGFFPPAHIPIGQTGLYMVLLLGAVILFSLGPVFILLFQKPIWKEKLDHELMQD